VNAKLFAGKAGSLRPGGLSQTDSVGSDCCYQPHGNSRSTLSQRVNAEDLGDVFGRHGVGGKSEWIGHEQAHASAIALKFRMKIDSSLRDVRADREFLKRLDLGIGRTRSFLDTLALWLIRFSGRLSSGLGMRL
jgi:hypothetical protein